MKNKVKTASLTPLNVLFITSWYPTPENPVQGVFVKEHAKAVRLYSNVQVLHCTGASQKLQPVWQLEKQKSTMHQIPVHTLQYKNIRLPKATYCLFMVSIIMAFLRLHKTFRPDVLHAHMYGLALPAILLGRLFRIPVFLTEHSSAFARRRMSRTERFKAKLAFALSHKSLPVSRFLREKIKALNIKGRFDVVPNCVDTDLFRFLPHKKKEQAEKQLLFVGMIGSSKVKGLDILINALLLLKSSRHDFVCHIVGDAHEKKWCTDLCRRLKLARHIVFHGRLPKKAIAELMQTSSFLVVPSRVETFSVVTAEALCCGLPVLCTKCGGPEELITTDCGRAVAPGDRHALFRQMMFMMDHIESFDSQAIAGSAQNRFSPETIGRRITSLYHRAVPRRSGIRV